MSAWGICASATIEEPHDPMQPRTAFDRLRLRPDRIRCTYGVRCVASVSPFRMVWSARPSAAALAAKMASAAATTLQRPR
eukprot:779941-Pleurochrysis_carterae.AAC.2